MFNKQGNAELLHGIRNGTALAFQDLRVVPLATTTVAGASARTTATPQAADLL